MIQDNKKKHIFYLLICLIKHQIHNLLILLNARNLTGIDGNNLKSHLSVKMVRGLSQSSISGERNDKPRWPHWMLGNSHWSKNTPVKKVKTQFTV